MTKRLRFTEILHNILASNTKLSTIMAQKRQSEIKILEIGCGAAEVTAELLESGYDSHGIDVEFKPSAKLEFMFSQNRIKKIGSDRLLRTSVTELKDEYIFPHEDNTFDISFSESTVEHVENLEEFVSENARVLKTGGVAIHYFPSKYSIIEPHIGVPFGGIIHNKTYYFIMIKLGLSFKRYRSKFGYVECYDFIESGTFYRSRKKYLQTFHNHGFGHLSDNADSVILAKVARGSKLANLIFHVKILKYFFKYVRSNVYIFEKL